MANSSDDVGSTASAGMSSINLIKGAALPEQWTLPSEWNIEKRELYLNWKLDVQSQIVNIDKKLGESMARYPDPTLENYPPTTDPQPELDSMHALLRGRMQTGLRRS